MKIAEKTICKMAKKLGLAISFSQSADGRSHYYRLYNQNDSINIRISDHFQPEEGSFHATENESFRSSFYGINVVGWERGAADLLRKAIIQALEDEENENLILAFGKGREIQKCMEQEKKDRLTKWECWEKERARTARAIVDRMTADEKEEIMNASSAIQATLHDGIPHGAARRQEIARPFMRRHGLGYAYEIHDISDALAAQTQTPEDKNS